MATKTKNRIEQTSPKEVEPQKIYYVGIGASAGGLEALRPFVANLPIQANMTYIVAQHMSPDHRSMMVELLVRETQLKVEEAVNNQTPKADTIYVAPPNADITVTNGKLRLSKPNNTIGPKPSVDRFFMSLADDQEDKAIGIVLSGTGSDGAHGIKAIKAAGGITIAQHPKSAKYDSMPNAAIRVGGADLVLPAQEIAVQLSSIVMRPRPPFEVDPENSPPSTIRGIVRQIATHVGMDFSNYKDNTISRQILRRMAAMQIPDLDAYGDYLNRHHSELNELASNFLICVTSFFRDRETFDAMRRTLKTLLHDKQPGDDIRIWVPGCATGEEVYSIAIVLAEELGGNREKYRIQIFATDINPEAVHIARAGIYPEAALAGVDGELIKRYFYPRDGMYHIDASLKEMTLFAKQDLIQDPPFVRLDMVSCRNLLIYFKPELQDRVLKIFHYAMQPGGVLFLGKSESVGKLGSLFAEKDRKNKVFIKRDIATPLIGSYPRNRVTINEKISKPSEKPLVTSSAVGHERLFDLYAPASLLITVDGEILEIYGDCTPFFSIKRGKADFNLFSIIKPVFRAEFRAFSHRVARTKKSAYSGVIALPHDGKTNHYRLAMHYINQQNMGGSELLLACFEEVASKVVKNNPASELNEDSNQRINELEQENVVTRENLQTVIEELETANEELQSLNEESQAANEELQASNEELETANEELQASNEELVTVNDELSTRTNQLADANVDMENVLNSLYKALVVVDLGLNVTRHNKEVFEFFSIKPGEKNNLATVPLLFEMPELLDRISRVMKTGAKSEYEFTMEGRYLLMRLTPCVSVSGKAIVGAVLVIMDISDQKAAEDKLRLSASVFEHASEATITTDENNHIIAVNPAFTRITGYTEAEVLGKNPRLLSSGLQSREFYQQMWESLLTKGFWKGEIFNKRKNGEIFPEFMSVNVLKDEQGKIYRHIAIFSDSTELKAAENEMLKAIQKAEAATRVKSEFLANMSHEIRTPMNAIIGLSQLALNKQMPAEIRDYLEKINASSESLLGILNAILDYSKMEAGKLQIENQRFNLANVLDNLHNLFSHRAGEKLINFDIEVAENVPNDLIGDALRLQQILSNLLGNAIKFTERGRVAIKIKLLDSEESQARVHFCVCDTGIGISPEDQANLFQPFSQVDTSATRRFSGTGLGLAISRNLLNLMGSDLHVESTQGQGSNFTFELLLSVASRELHHEVKRRNKARKAGALHKELRTRGQVLSGARILFAEDNRINQQVVKEFLTLSGVHADIANNGKEALILLEQNSYDAVLMDVHMPVMDGIEATENIRRQAKFKHLPVIALTAGVTKEEREGSLASGMNDFITKPINPEALIETLAKWIHPKVTTAPQSAGPDGWSKIEDALPGFDLSTLKTMIGENTGLLMGMLQSFFTDFAGESNVIMTHIQKQEIPEAEKLLHRLKGAAGSLGAKELHQACETLDAQLKKGAYSSESLGLWLKVYDKTMATLAEVLTKFEGLGKA